MDLSKLIVVASGKTFSDQIHQGQCRECPFHRRFPQSASITLHHSIHRRHSSRSVSAVFFLLLTLLAESSDLTTWGTPTISLLPNSSFDCTSQELFQGRDWQSRNQRQYWDLRARRLMPNPTTTAITIEM
jgi:hypothetical protein